MFIMVVVSYLLECWESSFLVRLIDRCRCASLPDGNRFERLSLSQHLKYICTCVLSARLHASRKAIHIINALYTPGRARFIMLRDETLTYDRRRRPVDPDYFYYAERNWKTSWLRKIDQISDRTFCKSKSPKKKKNFQSKFDFQKWIRSASFAASM